MFLKIIGSILVVGASAYLGFFCSRDMKRRPYELRVLQGLLQIFENEISYLSNMLTDAFEKVYKSTDSQVARFFKDTMGYLKEGNGISADQAWEKSIKENIKYTALDKEDEQIMVAFGRMLGSSDLEGQVKNIRLTLTQLEMQEKKAENARNKSEAMYKKLGLLGGLAIVILLV